MAKSPNPVTDPKKLEALQKANKKLSDNAQKQAKALAALLTTAAKQASVVQAAIDKPGQELPDEEG